MAITRRSIRGSDMSGKHVPFLILTVTLDPEYDVIRKLLPTLGAKKKPRDAIDNKLNIDCWTISKKLGGEIRLATGFLHKMGNSVSALETYVFIEKVSPTYIFLCGIAGSLDPSKAKLGDVVIASTIDWLVMNKIASDAFHHSIAIGDKHFRIESRTNGGLTDRWEKNLAAFVKKHETMLPSNNEDDWLRFKADNGISAENALQLAGVISVDYVLNDRSLREKLCERHSGALAVEMEGGGFEYALRRRREEHPDGDNGPRGFVFRGIADLAHNKDGEDKRWREVAMHNVAHALVTFINTFDNTTVRTYWETPPMRQGESAQPGVAVRTT